MPAVILPLIIIINKLQILYLYCIYYITHTHTHASITERLTVRLSDVKYAWKFLFFLYIDAIILPEPIGILLNDKNAISTMISSWLVVRLTIVDHWNFSSVCNYYSSINVDRIVCYFLFFFFILKYLYRHGKS